MNIFVLHALHNPYWVLNVGWHDPLKHNLTHKRAEMDHFKLNLNFVSLSPSFVTV